MIPQKSTAVRLVACLAYCAIAPLVLACLLFVDACRLIADLHSFGFEVAVAVYQAFGGGDDESFPAMGMVVFFTPLYTAAFFGFVISIKSAVEWCVAQ